MSLSLFCLGLSFSERFSFFDIFPSWRPLRFFCLKLGVFVGKIQLWYSLLSLLRLWTWHWCVLFKAWRLSDARLSDLSLLHSSLIRFKLIIAKRDLSFLLSGYHNRLWDIQGDRAFCESYWCLSCLSKSENWLINALAQFIILWADIAMMFTHNFAYLLPYCWRWSKLLFIRSSTSPAGSADMRLIGSHRPVASS